MGDYDFRGLSPTDFEALCHDLLEIRLNVKLQAFATGPGKGIDLRHAATTENTLIVQCKHYARSGFSKVLSNLGTKELPKIQKLAPKRYVLITSIALSPDNVDRIFDLLQPHCNSKLDIIGATDINATLRQNNKLESSHFKLWLSSTAVLQRMLNNGIFTAAAMTQEEITTRLGLYVKTSAYEPAKERLKKDHVCILSGAAGVGKTTLAEILVIAYQKARQHKQGEAGRFCL